MLRVKTLLIVAAMLLGGTVACRAPAPVPTPTATPSVAIPTDIPVTPTAPVAAAPGQPATTPSGPYGPTGFPPDVNPLTGLQVADPDILNRRPQLIKISNESSVVRPQSGWAFADHVWEYQMEGFAQTRYTAVIYSQSPQQVGSVRSARLIDLEHLMDMYGGILVFSGGSSNFRHEPPGPPRIMELVLAAPWRNRAMSEQQGYSAPYLVRIPDVPRPGTAGWHTLFAVPSAIWQWATETGVNQRPNLDGLAFNPAPPAGGTPTTEVAVDYPGIGPKHTWRWDATVGRWLSWTDDQPDGDYLLPGQQLAFDNIVILHVPHSEADFLEQEGTLGELYSVRANLTGQGDGVLLRDGQRYPVRWNRVTTEGMLRFTDASGAIIPFKPGTTFFHTADTVFFPPQITFLP
jgi:hypothetical protein